VCAGKVELGGTDRQRLANLAPTAEAIVRGHKSGLLTIPDYNNLTQCEALDDIKLNLVKYPMGPKLRSTNQCWFILTGPHFADSN
jgi:hypothetical protein